MNVTELARRLRIPTSEVRELLPLLGFDIGRKAIKVDDKVAQKIIDRVRENPNIVKRVHAESEEEEEQTEELVASSVSKEVTIPTSITVRDFAELLNKPVATIIQELMKNGILANLNEQIDYETASILAQDSGFTTIPLDENEQTTSQEDETTIEQILGDDSGTLTSRPPVVIVMGHVDHGKTQLLDTIRKTNVVAKESGGITQSIGAYQVTKNKKLITFIDTPGHEAFTAMRSRGARAADIAIIVIAAEEGIKPQTEETLKIVENAKLPFLVAINKIDKPEADVEKVKQQLAQKDLLPEDWGGKVMCAPVSAKTGKGIDELLEQLLLLAEVEQENIRANSDRSAVGTIIESHVDKGEGPVATVLIQSGTLKRGDSIQTGHAVGKIRAMKDFNGDPVDSAPPSMPVRILGLKGLPEVGDFLRVVADDRSLKKIAKQQQHRQRVYRDKQTWQAKRAAEEKKTEKQSLNIILKTDTLGSQEALLQSLEAIESEDASVTIIKKALGSISDADILEAEGMSNTIVYGFNVKATTRANEIAQDRSVSIRTYEIIYDLIDDVNAEIDKLKKIKVEIVELGRAKVLAIFRTEKKYIIVGSLITKGKFEKDAKVRVIRDDATIATATATKLQRGQQETKSIPSGTECGIQLDGTTDVKEGDFLEAYREELSK